MSGLFVELAPGILPFIDDMEPNHTIGRLIGAVSAMGGLISGLVIVRMALQKRYRGFRVVLVPVDSPASGAL